MTCIPLRDGFLCTSNATEGEVTVRGRPVRFEFDPRFGPAVLTKRGTLAANVPAGFWPAFAKWYAARGGPPVEVPPKMLHLGGRHWIAARLDGTHPTVSGKPVPLCPGCPKCAPEGEEGGT